MGESGFFALFIAVGVIGGSLLLGPVGQALGRLIGAKRGGDSKDGLSTGEMAAQRVVELEARVAELEEQQSRVLELEERLDFAERLLASGEARDADPATPTPR
ncbi:MAG: hypothetical protein R2909_06025 [Gemmatimonadales bacterium]